MAGWGKRGIADRIPIAEVRLLPISFEDGGVGEAWPNRKAGYHALLQSRLLGKS